MNILSPDDLVFGNHFIRRCFDSQKNKLKNKRIYVISVIGVQSSAKSYLLNKLFDASFEVSGGRCTLGLNMVIYDCKEDKDKTLLIIDTEGTSSLERHSKDFDIRLTSFLMLMSDVLIINSKG